MPERRLRLRVNLTSNAKKYARLTNKCPQWDARLRRDIVLQNLHCSTPSMGKTVDEAMDTGTRKYNPWSIGRAGPDRGTEPCLNLAVQLTVL